jgi:glyoxylase-like metal-dependent hydrolase (beta-lactamase superfamily II)
VLFTGDLVFHEVNPVLMKKSGASVDKWIVALNTILTRWDVKMLVPGHGPTGGRELTVQMKQYFEDMKLAAKDPSKAKKLEAKYKDWITMPTMASPAMTVDYIREHP